MQTKESVSTELDPNVPVEDVVIALNDSTVGEQVTNEAIIQPALVTISNMYYYVESNSHCKYMNYLQDRKK